jgi:hypothetical protein
LMELARMIALILLALNLLAALVKSKVDLKPEMPGSGSGCLCCQRSAWSRPVQQPPVLRPALFAGSRRSSRQCWLSGPRR